MRTNRYNGNVCKTCRRRGRACDKALPACGTCIAKGLECEGYTLRWTGVASRGKLAGKAIPVVDDAEEEKKKKKPHAKDLKGNASASSSSSSSSKVARRPNTTAIVPKAEVIYPIVRSTMTPRNIKDEAIWMDSSASPDSLDALNDIMETFADSGSEDYYDENYVDGKYAKKVSADKRQALKVSRYNNKLPRDNKNDRFYYTDPVNEFRKGAYVFFRSAHVPQELSEVLNYHIVEVNPRLCVDHATTRNPYREYIMALAFQSPCLLYACAALAASHYRVRTNAEPFLVKSLIYKGKAMKLLQQDLQDEEKAKHPATLSAVLMLLLCDICLGGEHKHEEHFKGARQLIFLRGAERTEGSFVEQYFVWLDTMSATSSRREPAFSLQDIHVLTQGEKSTPENATLATMPAQPLISPGFRRWYGDAFPCPTDQFDVLCRIVQLYKLQRDPDNPTTETLKQAKNLKGEVLNLKPDKTLGEGWLHVSEAYRHSIILMLLRLFRLRDTPEGADESRSIGRIVFDHIQCTVAGTGYSDQMLWPLLHAGLELEDKQDQQWLRDRSKEMLASGGFRNVVDAMGILEKYWADPRERKKSYMELVGGNSSRHMIFL